MTQKDNPHSIWSFPPEVLDLQPHQVDVWRVGLELPLDVLDQQKAALSADETQRAARFHFPADRDRYIAAHGGLRDILSRYLHCEPNQPNFITNPYGKPALHGHKLEFNLSHSGDFALIAITRQRKVGVDIERIRQGISSHVIVRQYFSKSEVAELQRLPNAQREVAFFTCWTRKEAYIKAQGMGLSLPLESFDVSLTPNEPAILRATRPDAQEAARWTLLSLEIDPRYKSAIAVESIARPSNDQGLEFRLWDWNTNR
jgi:4'-phosphopantetheinyl transferase